MKLQVGDKVICTFGGNSEVAEIIEEHENVVKVKTLNVKNVQLFFNKKDVVKI